MGTICDCDTASALVCKENPDCRPSFCKMRKFDPPITAVIPSKESTHDLACALDELGNLQEYGDQEDLCDRARLRLTAQEAEIERLEHDLTLSMEATAQYLNEAERLTVERDRLRAALQEIADGHFFGSEEMLFARAALAEPGEKG